MSNKVGKLRICLFGACVSNKVGKLRICLIIDRVRVRPNSMKTFTCFVDRVTVTNPFFGRWQAENLPAAFVSWARFHFVVVIT